MPISEKEEEEDGGIKRMSFLLFFFFIAKGRLLEYLFIATANVSRSIPPPSALVPPPATASTMSVAFYVLFCSIFEKGEETKNTDK